MPGTRGRIAGALLVLLLATVAVSPSTAQRGNSIIHAATNRGLTNFVDAVRAANLEGALTDSSLTATVFVPTNRAFSNTLRQLGYTSLGQLASQQQLLVAVLQHHVVAGRAIKESDLPGASPLTTLLPGQSLRVHRRWLCDFTVTSAGGATAKITTDDVRVGKIIFHVVDAVLLPNVSALSISPAPPAPPSPPSPSFSSILSAVTSIPELSVLGLAARLATTTPNSGPLGNASAAVTVFAPTNAAFSRWLGVEVNSFTLATLLASGPARLREIGDVLAYHVVPTVARAADLSNGQVLPTLLPSRTLTVRIGSGAVNISGDLSTARVLRTDIGAGQSVIHIIDTVLLPSKAPLSPPSPPAARSVADAVVAAGPQLSTLLAAVQAANLTSLLSSTSLVATVFAPTNEAFSAALAKLNITLAALVANKPLLTKILQYHLVPNVSARAASLSDGQVLPTALTGRSLTVDLVAGGGVRIEAEASVARVVAADVPAGQAIVHVVDTVLLPDFSRAPYESFADAVTRAPALSTLATALAAADLVTTFTNPDLPYTLFAPTNAAFSAALTALNTTLADLAANKALLTSILSVHVSPQVLRGADLLARATTGGVSAQIPTSAGLGKFLVVSVSNGTLVLSGGQGSSARVTADANLVAGAGIIHVIDAVLLP